MVAQSFKAHLLVAYFHTHFHVISLLGARTAASRTKKGQWRNPEKATMTK